jgi:hypothetical protein
MNQRVETLTASEHPGVFDYLGGEVVRLPSRRGVSLTVVAEAYRPTADAAPATTVLVSATGAAPHGDYTMFSGGCGARADVVANNVAGATADARGRFTMAAPSLGIAPTDRNWFVEVVPRDSQTSLGGLRSPFVQGKSTILNPALGLQPC